MEILGYTGKFLILLSNALKCHKLQASHLSDRDQIGKNFKLYFEIISDLQVGCKVPLQNPASPSAHLLHDYTCCVNWQVTIGVTIFTDQQVIFKILQCYINVVFLVEASSVSHPALVSSP